MAKKTEIDTSLNGTMTGDFDVSEIKGPLYPCPTSEQETIIQFSRDETEICIWTNNLNDLTRFKSLVKRKNSGWKLIGIDYACGRQCGWRFKCPKDVLGFKAHGKEKQHGETAETASR